MKFKRIIFVFLFLTTLLAVGLSSCNDETYNPFDTDNDWNTKLHDHTPLVILNIKPVTRVRSLDDSDPDERIKYLRIVMLDKDEIEFNRLISFVPANVLEEEGIIPEEPVIPDEDTTVDSEGETENEGEGGDDENEDESDNKGEEGKEEDDDVIIAGANSYGDLSSSLNYRYVFPSKIGKKSFFLIANEQSVPSVKFQFPEDFIVPEGLQKLINEKEESLSLTDVLNYYSGGYVGNHTDAPGEFAMVMNSLYFTPDYSVDENNNIYLPYTAFYDGYEIETTNKVEGEVGVQDLGSMYLVPCATKFKFRFRNYRPHKVTVPSFKISGIANTMYLFGQVQEKEQYKDYGTEKNLWWIDWLYKISLASQEHTVPDNNYEFSTRYGWIDAFDIPSDAYTGTEEETIDKKEIKGIYNLIEEEDNESWEIPEIVSGDPIHGVPGEWTTGFFYAPESRYPITYPIYDDDGKPNGSMDLQTYYLKLQLNSGSSGTASVTKDLKIGNLGSLFRNTYTYITITMRDATDVGAYAQIEPWEESHTNGTVLEETNE